MMRRRGLVVRGCPTLVALLSITAGCAGGPRPAVAPGVRASTAVTRLQNDISRLLAAPELEHTTWGILARSLTRDETMYGLNPRKLLVPASNMKVVTLASAAERLGWQFAFETRLVAGGPVDAGVLTGDLIVVGGGDPSLDDWDGAATRLFSGWASELKARGITRIAGRIVGDDNRLDDQLLGSGWAWDDLANSFAAPVGALQFNENTTRLSVSPAGAVGDPASVSVAPAGTGLILRSAVRTTAAGSPIAIDSRRGAGSAVLELRGAIPHDAMPIVRNVSVYNPTLYFVTALRDALIANGIDVAGSAVDADDVDPIPPVDPASTLIAYSSPPLPALAQTMMKNSQNLFAESLFTIVGSRAGVRAVLQGWGIDESSVVVADGSGLSRNNLVSAEALVAILSRVYEDDRSREPFMASLPVAGEDGTLAGDMKGTAAQGNARAKTGSMSNVRALSGYVRTADGEPLVFSILANNYGIPADRVQAALDAIVVRLAGFRRE